MKKLIFSLIGLFTLCFLNAQSNMVIHQGNGSTLSLPLQSIDSVRFILIPSPVTKRIFQNNGNILSLSVADIDSITFTIPNRSTLPTLTTQAVTVLSSSSAFGGGNISADGGSAITQRGVCWNTSPNPTLANNFTVDGTGLGSYGSSMQPLSPSTTYYVRAYATNANGTSYGSQVSFVTAPANSGGSLPTISTNQVVYMDSLSAFCGGNITADGGLAVTARGVCWAIGTTPTINHSRTVDGAGGGSFNSRLSNLLPNTSYFVRAYATNAAGTAYGISYSFTTKGFATVATDSVFDIMALRAKASGRVLNDGGVSVTERGFCWSLNSNPTVNDNKVLAGNGLGSFAQQIQSLAADTTIYVRAFAGSSIGFSYGNQIAFRTLTGIPIVITDSVFNIGAFSANVSGNVINSNGATVISRGFCWSLTPNPKISDFKTNNGNSLGYYQGSLTSLLADTIYYIRAYSTTNAGTGYGNQVIFRTQTGIPTVITDSVFDIGAFTANTSGNVINSNGANVISRGFCWSLTPNPTISDFKTNNGNSLGYYQGSLTSLLADTIYYIRAYSTTNAGTGYGNQVIFRTQTGIPTVITDSVFDIGAFTANTSGNVINSNGANVISRGFCWSLNPIPTINDSITINGNGIGVFLGNLSNLLNDTLYYVRAYSTTNAGTGYGNQIIFRTQTGIPSVITDSVFNIRALKANVSGNVINDNGAYINLRGFCISLKPNPTINDLKTNNGSIIGVFSEILSNLLPDTIYYVKAYATTKAGTGYGNQISFKTKTGIPSVVTDSVFNIKLYSANASGEILDSNGDTIKTRGFCFSLSPNPTLIDSVIVNGNGVGAYSLKLANLLRDTIYYVRAFATSDVGTGYGGQISFRTQSGIPIVVTDSVFNISLYTANVNGKAINDNGDSIKTRGFCWSLNPNPTINDSITIIGSGIGFFSSKISKLFSDTIYYVRAFATTHSGTGYGGQISFRSYDLRKAYPSGSVFCSSGATDIVDVTNSITGKTWMDRNLGATRRATSSTDSLAFGDLYQWGRRSDGHQCRNTSTDTILSSSDQPSHGNYIFSATNLIGDWRSPQNDSLWQGVNGINNPCPIGYRLPTRSETEAERLSWSTNNASGAFASPLKFTLAGKRFGSSTFSVGISGEYWSSSTNGTTDAGNLQITTSSWSLSGGANRINGSSIRCIKN